MDRATIKQKLLEIMEQSVGEPVGAVEESMNLKEDLKLDSIDFVSMAIAAQGEFDIELKTQELIDVVQVKDLLDLIQRKVAANHHRAA